MINFSKKIYSSIGIAALLMGISGVYPSSHWYGASSANATGGTGQCKLEITKSVDKATASPGDTLVYTLNFKNTGTANCTGGGVHVEDVVSTQVTFLSETHTSNVTAGYNGVPLYQSSNRTLTWNANVLTPGESGSVTWYAKVNTPQACGTYDIPNTGRITSLEYSNFTVWVYSNTVHTTLTVPCASTLKVIKHVINDNGRTAIASDFTMTVNGVTAQGGNSFPGSETGTTKVITSFGSYNVTESGPTGYTATFSAGCSGTIATGESKTCTVTNDDTAPPPPTTATLTVIKHVINDNGGTAVAGDFTMTINGFTALANSAVTCTDGNITGGDVGTFQPGAVTLTTCPISGTVHMGDDAAVAAYNNFENMYEALAPQPGDCDPAHTFLTTIPASITLLPGTYCTDGVLTATGVTLTLDAQGDSNAVWLFKIGTMAAAALTGTNFSVVLANGAVASNVTWWVGAAASMTTSAFQGNILAGAAITTTGGTLNGNAWSKAALTFTGTVVTGCGVTAQGGNSFPGSETGTTKVITSFGCYNVTEAGPAGYTATFSAGCSGTIALGESKTCTVTNNDIAPPPTTATLIVIKHVINIVGTATASNFTMTINGVTAQGGNSFPGSETGTTKVITSFGAYDVAELVPMSTFIYFATFSADCIGTIAAGETKTCTVTNSEFSSDL